jgi:hypothetical protein
MRVVLTGSSLPSNPTQAQPPVEPAGATSTGRATSQPVVYQTLGSRVLPRRAPAAWRRHFACRNDLQLRRTEQSLHASGTQGQLSARHIELAIWIWCSVRNLTRSPLAVALPENLVQLGRQAAMLYEYDLNKHSFSKSRP